ncbi:MAG: DUF5367 family protein [Chitinophagales bacterium]
MKNSQTPLFVVLGAIFWFAAAMTIRLLGATVFSANNPYLIGMFVLAFPITCLFIFITMKVAKIKSSELLVPAAIMTYSATFLDAIALAWFGELYGETLEIRLYGATWILWGVGIGLLLAHFLSKK